MKFFFSLTLMLTFISCVAHAEPAIQTTLNSGDVLRGEFSETRHLKGFTGPMAMTGNFTVAPGYGLIWDAQKPFTITTIITPDRLRQISGGVVVSNLPASKVPFLLHLYDTLSGALAGDWQALNKDYIVTRTQSGDHWQMDLKPRQSDMVGMPFDAITVTGSKFVEAVHTFKKDGDSEDIQFRRQSVSRTAPNAGELSLFSASSQ